MKYRRPHLLYLFCLGLCGFVLLMECRWQKENNFVEIRERVEEEGRGRGQNASTLLVSETQLCFQATETSLDDSRERMSTLLMVYYILGPVISTKGILAKLTKTMLPSSWCYPLYPFSQESMVIPRSPWCYLKAQSDNLQGRNVQSYVSKKDNYMDYKLLCLALCCQRLAWKSKPHSDL